MKEKYYLAYGSNLSIAQMVQRCPYAVYVGKATIPNYQLLFKGSQSGSYLTIEKKEGSSVPVLVWKITEYDEARLDRYEGYPAFYYKKDIKLQYKGIRTGKRRTINAFAYIMHEDRPIGVPSIYYMKTCLDGYDTFYFDKQILLNAYKNSMEMCENEK